MSVIDHPSALHIIAEFWRRGRRRPIHTPQVLSSPSTSPGATRPRSKLKGGKLKWESRSGPIGIEIQQIRRRGKSISSASPLCRPYRARKGGDALCIGASVQSSSCEYVATKVVLRRPVTRAQKEEGSGSGPKAVARYRATILDIAILVLPWMGT